MQQYSWFPVIPEGIKLQRPADGHIGIPNNGCNEKTFVHGTQE
jgi:hypothetical protein